MYLLLFLNKLGLLSNYDGVRLAHEIYITMSLEEMKVIAGECFNLVIRNSLYTEAIEAVNKYKLEGAKVFLASGSPSMIIEKICEYLSTESCVATEYSVENDIITGIAGPICYNEGKVKILERRGLLDSPFILYTDDISDLPLINKAARVYLVNPRRKLIKTVESLNISSDILHWSH